MAISTAQGRVSQLVGSAANTAPYGGFVAAFVCMSNELSTPKLLICSSDSSRSSVATNFPQIFNALWNNSIPPTPIMTSPNNYAASFTSYFLCGDAAEDYPQMILMGDRNIGNIGNGGAGSLVSGQASSYINFGTNNIVSTTGNGTVETFPWGWSATDLHQKAGNLAIADGSVQQATCSGLMTSLLNATNDTPTSDPVYNIP
jgi:hypothetical protein